VIYYCNGFPFGNQFPRGNYIEYQIFTHHLSVMNTFSKKYLENQPVKTECCAADHNERVMAIRDAVEVLSGKWKVQIIGTLLFGGKQRFMDLLRIIDGIGAKMLSKELHDLEVNQLITRTVRETKPITVEYEITEYGKSLETVIKSIANWGLQHRRKIMGRDE
jgi:DNA-binding HxlR family transcriptional regulator